MPNSKHEMDRGWAWVVLACSWMGLFLVCFLSASAGILQVEMIEDFGVGSGPISIMTSFALGLASLLGPLSGIMASLLSARATVFIGTILMSFGMLATSFSHTIPAMVIFYGIFTGLGFGIAYSPMVVIISFYFEKQRILANGIILCASGVGMLSLPFFERYIIDSYGWRYAFALNGAIMLHILVFAAAFFPNEMERKSMIKFSCLQEQRAEYDTSRMINDQKLNKTNNEDFEAEKKFINSSELKRAGIQSRKYDMILKSGLMVDSSSISKSQTLSVNSSSATTGNTPYIPVYITEATDIKKVLQLPSGSISVMGGTPLRNGSVLEELENGFTSPSPFRQRTHSELSGRSAFSTDTHASTLVLPDPTQKYKFGQLRKGGSTSGRSYLGSGFGWASSDLGSSIMLPLKIEEVTVADTEEKTSIFEQITRICKNKAVWILSVNSFFFISGFAIHSVHFPSYAESKGMTRQQVAQFYTVYGLVLMAGRLAGGLIYNKLKPPLCILIFILQTLNGLAMGFAPLYADSSVGIFILQACFGLLYGQAYMVLPAILAQILGVQDLAIAFGIIHLFMGLGYILAPIIAGFIFDVTKTYDIPYYIGGAFFLLGALSLILMVFVKREADAGQMDDRDDRDAKMDDREANKEKMTSDEEGTMQTSPVTEEQKI